VRSSLNVNTLTKPTNDTRIYILLVWMSPSGYNHQHVGQKVAQIQAVLARRCAAIGELQELLLRAGWQKGVAQWAVIGDGGQFGLTGFDGTMGEGGADDYDRLCRLSSDLTGNDATDTDSTLHKRRWSKGSEDSLISPTRPQLSRIPSHKSSLVRDEMGQASVNFQVEKTDGGGIFVDDPQFLAEWSVQAIALVRKHLVRSANGSISLPFEENWRQDTQEGGELIVDSCDTMAMPKWALETPADESVSRGDRLEESLDYIDTKPNIKITDLRLLAEEVASLLDVMEPIMDIQRHRRLDVLRPPTWMRTNWYLVGAAIPTVTVVLFKMLRGGYAKRVVGLAVEKVTAFYREHLVNPVNDILTELWKGRKDFSDQAARKEAIESLKKMILSWLNDNYPEMPEMDRLLLSESMDVTLIEQDKVAAMQSFFELNNVVRMSFIEMQYMKKVCRSKLLSSAF
jgi:hypothetical protein